MGIHFEALRVGSTLLTVLRVPNRLRVALAIVFALIAHLAEVLLFCVGWILLHRLGSAYLSQTDPDFTDLFYFSLVTYTSLGYGDIVPLGPARVLAGVQSLVGLVLIAWTASFTYLQMQRYWSDDDA